MVSLMTVTLDRYDLAVECLGPALKNAGYPCELLSVDNGSKDRRVAEFIQSLKPVYHQVNEQNLGYSPMLNQMLLRASGDYLCILDPDIEVPRDWLWKLVHANEAIPDSGICGIHCIQNLNSTESEENGVKVCFQTDVFGVKFFSRRVLNVVGGYQENFGVYGCEDNDYNYRVQKMGFRSYYLAGEKSIHRGEDCGSTGPYRKMKWDNLYNVASPALQRNREQYERSGNYYVALPALV